MYKKPFLLDKMTHCQDCSGCAMRQQILKFGDPTKICEHCLNGICTLEEAKIPHTLEEIGAMMNVTRERIRQIELKVLRRLRHPKKAIKLKPFYMESLANKREGRQPFESFGG